MTNPKIDKDGNKFWLDADGDLHREDGPAIEWANGCKYWYRKGLLHREDGAAVEGPDSQRWWYLDGKLQRTDGFMVELPDGTLRSYSVHSGGVLADVFTDRAKSDSNQRLSEEDK